MTTPAINLKYEYECSLSGVTAPGELPYAGDGLDDLPQGWIEVRLSRRLPNPKYILIQRVKEAMASALVSQYPKEIRDAQEVAIRVQLDAQFYGLENGTPPYVTDVETVYLSPPESSEDMADAVNQLRELVGLAPLEDGDDDEEDSDVVEAPAAAEPSPESSPVGDKKKKKPLPETQT